MNSFILSLRFLSVQNKFSYRLVLEIALIATLVVSVSGMLDGASTQFSTLLTQANTSTPSYMIIQKGTTFETSKIPVDVIKKIDTSYFVTYNPVVYKQATINHTDNVPFIYANYTPILNDQDNFILIQGTIPKNKNELLLGEGLKNQLFNSLPIPSQITLKIGNESITKTVTGVFSDNSIFDYSLVENINFDWSNMSSISFFLFQIKNYKVIPAFISETNNLAQEMHSDLKLNVNPLQKTTALGQAFYNDVHNLFFYLEIVMIIMLSLKITHASYTLFYRYYDDFLTLRILGMSNKNLQVIFYIILIMIGNLGLVYGFIVGLALPHVFLLMIRIAIKYQGLYIVTPSIQDVSLLIIFTNIIVVLNSFWIAKMHLQEKLVPNN